MLNKWLVTQTNRVSLRAQRKCYYTITFRLW